MCLSIPPTARDKLSGKPALLQPAEVGTLFRCGRRKLEGLHGQMLMDRLLT
jgi:hypothetical protein